MPAARIYADWGYAARVGGEVVGCEFFTQNTGPYAHFSYLVRNVNTFFKTVSSSQPAEVPIPTLAQYSDVAGAVACCLVPAASQSRHLTCMCFRSAQSAGRSACCLG